MITTRALAAHFQLMQQLPVRTVKGREHSAAGAYKPTADETRDLNARICSLEKEGYLGYEIAEIVGKSRATVSHHLNGRIATVAKATKPRRQ